MKKPSSRSLLSTTVHRLRCKRRHDDLRAYLAGDEFLNALCAMDPADRAHCVLYAAKIWSRYAKRAPLLAPMSVRVKSWDDAKIALLRKLNAQFGNDADIARAMRLPRPAVKTARWKYCGPRVPKATQAEAVHLQHADAR